MGASKDKQRELNLAITTVTIINPYPLFVMDAKIEILHQFLQGLWPQTPPHRGKLYVYNWPSMLLFFLVMLLKGIHSYKGMACFAKRHHPCFEWLQEYNQLANTPQARWLYRQRKATVEPVFSLIKEIDNLSGEKQLPYRGLNKVKPYLLMITFSVQLIMYYNYLNKVELATTKLLLNDFKYL